MSDQELIEMGKRRAKEAGLPLVEEYYSTLSLLGGGSAGNGPWPMYKADVVHRLLGSGTEVYNAHSAQGLEYAQGKDRTWFQNLTHTSTLKGLLIGIQKIEKEPIEERMAQLLKELIAAQEFTKINITYIPEEWAERAKQLLNERGRSEV